jgi:hypothetical protein
MGEELDFFATSGEFGKRMKHLLFCDGRVVNASSGPWRPVVPSGRAVPLRRVSIVSAEGLSAAMGFVATRQMHRAISTVDSDANAAQPSAHQPPGYSATTDLTRPTGGGAGIGQ